MRRNEAFPSFGDTLMAGGAGGEESRGGEGRRGAQGGVRVPSCRRRIKLFAGARARRSVSDRARGHSPWFYFVSSKCPSGVSRHCVLPHRCGVRRRRRLKS